MSQYGPTADGTSIIKRFPVAASTSISDGDMLTWDSDSRNVVPATAGDAVLGVAIQDVDNSSGSDGTLTVAAEIGNKIFVYPADDTSDLGTSVLRNKVAIEGSQQLDCDDLSGTDVATIIEYDSGNNRVYCFLDFSTADKTS